MQPFTERAKAFWEEYSALSKKYGVAFTPRLSVVDNQPTPNEIPVVDENIPEKESIPVKNA